jgi:hypothetical protein
VLVVAAIACGDGAGACPSVSAETLDACATACESGDAEVCARIGVAHERGALGRGPDLDAARGYFERACGEASDEDRGWLCVLGPSDAVDADREASARALEELCEEGSLLACHELARVVVVTPSIPIDLPRTVEAPTTTITIGVLPDGSLLIDGAPTTLDAIRATTPPVDTRAVIAADRSAPHGRVVEVIDALRAAGVTRYAINVAPEGPAP